MGKPKYADRRDANEAALVALAERLGCAWHRGPPLDGWAVFRGRWMPVEIKRPEREAQAQEYTRAQLQFLRWCTNRSAPWWLWRTEADVMRDLGARVSA